MSVAEMPIAMLLQKRSEIDARIVALTGGAACQVISVAVKGKKARVGGPTAWSDWTKKMLAENKEAVKAFKEAAPIKVGAHLKWLSANKGKESPEWKAYQAEWQAAHPKDSDEDAEESVASKSSGRRGPKKLDEMTVEERSAHDATIAARRAKAAAAPIVLVAV